MRSPSCHLFDSSLTDSSLTFRNFVGGLMVKVYVHKVVYDAHKTLHDYKEYHIKVDNTGTTRSYGALI